MKPGVMLCGVVHVSRTDAPSPSHDEGFADFYAATYHATVAQVYTLVGVYADAEEVTQEAFARALQRWRQVSAYDLPAAWVRRVAVNLALNRLQRARRAARALVRLGPAPDVPPISADTLALAKALRTVPVHYRQVIVLHYVAELSVEEIAAELELPSGTVKTRLARGRRRLAKLLDDTEEDLGAGTARTAAGAPRRARRPDTALREVRLAPAGS